MCQDVHAPSSAALRAPWSGGVACGAAAFVGMHPDKSKLLKLCCISKNRCILRVSARASAYAKSAGRVDGCRRIWHGERFILILPVRRVAARLTLYAVCRCGFTGSFAARMRAEGICIRRDIRLVAAAAETGRGRAEKKIRKIRYHPHGPSFTCGGLICRARPRQRGIC